MSRRFIANLSSLMYSGAGSGHGGSSNLFVTHDRANHRFSVQLSEQLEPTRLQSTIAPEGTHKTTSTVPGTSEEAVLRYSYIGNKTVDLSSTTVPPVFRGQGVGRQLAQAALNFVVEEDLKAHVSCWFIRKYLQDNPQYRDRIVN